MPAKVRLDVIQRQRLLEPWEGGVQDQEDGVDMARLDDDLYVFIYRRRNDTPEPPDVPMDDGIWAVAVRTDSNGLVSAIGDPFHILFKYTHDTFYMGTGCIGRTSATTARVLAHGLTNAYSDPNEISIGYVDLTVSGTTISQSGFTQLDTHTHTTFTYPYYFYEPEAVMGGGTCIWGKLQSDSFPSSNENNSQHYADTTLLTTGAYLFRPVTPIPGEFENDLLIGFEYRLSDNPELTDPTTIYSYNGSLTALQSYFGAEHYPDGNARRVASQIDSDRVMLAARSFGRILHITSGAAPGVMIYTASSSSNSGVIGASPEAVVFAKALGARETGGGQKPKRMPEYHTDFGHARLFAPTVDPQRVLTIAIYGDEDAPDDPGGGVMIEVWEASFPELLEEKLLPCGQIPDRGTAIAGDSAVRVGLPVRTTVSSSSNKTTTTAREG